MRLPFTNSMVESVAEVLGRVNSLPPASNNNHNEAHLREESAPRTKRYYRFRIGSRRSFKVVSSVSFGWPEAVGFHIADGSFFFDVLQVRFDRLALLALLDRDVSLMDSVLCIVLALAVGVMTASILHSGILHDLYVFLFCIVCAGCQYSLLKSVQPDAASPTHG